MNINPTKNGLGLKFTQITRNDAKALYAIFNYYHNTQLFEDESVFDKVHEILTEMYGSEVYVSNGIIANNVDYISYYK